MPGRQRRAMAPAVMTAVFTSASRAPSRRGSRRRRTGHPLPLRRRPRPATATTGTGAEGFPSGHRLLLGEGGAAAGGDEPALGGQGPHGYPVPVGVLLRGRHHLPGVGDDPRGAEAVYDGAEESAAEVGQHLADLVAGEGEVPLAEVEDGLLDEELVPLGVAGDVGEESVLLDGRETLGDRQTTGHVMSLR